MPYNAGGIKVIAPQFASCLVTITNQANGTTPTLYSDAAMTSAVTLPVTLTANATGMFYFTSSGAYTLSVKYGGTSGTEIADPRNNSTLNFDIQPGEVQTYDHRRTTIPASAFGGTLAGLSIGKPNVNIPVGLHTHFAADTASNGTDYSVTYRTFHPLVDPNVDAVLPVFCNQGVSTAGGAVDFDAPNSITVSAAVETSDGAIVPFVFNGAATVTLPAVGGQIAIPDYPISFGAQVTTTDKFSVTTSPGVWIRTYVSVAQSRVDTAGITSGQSLVTDASIVAGDAGRAVSGTGIPAVAYVSSVIANTSFVLSSSPITSTPVNATATNASASLTIKSVIPQNLNNYANGEANTTGNGGANLTLPGSGAVSGGTGSYYGPWLLLGRSTVRKPIVAILSDSIFDGYSDDFHSTYYGPIQRACDSLKYPMVKLSRGGETAASFAAPLSRRFRAMALAGCTHAIVEFGTNDGVTAGQDSVIATRLTNIGNFLVSLGIKPYLATVPPRGTSTDGFTSDAGFTASSTISVLSALNARCRVPLTPYLGVLDLADLSMTARDSGIWIRGANSRRLTDLNVTSGAATVTSATANFTSADVGTSLMMTTAYPNGVNIDSVTNATTCVVHSNSGSTQTGVVGGVGAFYGTGDGVHPSDVVMRGTLTAAAIALMSTWSV
jgi:hypothetical protein